MIDFFRDFAWAIWEEGKRPLAVIIAGFVLTNLRSHFEHNTNKADIVKNTEKLDAIKGQLNGNLREVVREIVREERETVQRDEKAAPAREERERSDA